MGKGARTKAGSAEKRAAQQEKEIQARKERKRNGIIAIAVVAVLLIGVGALIGVNAYRNSGAEQREAVVLETEHFKVNGQMMNYLIFSQYKNYYTQLYSYYGDQISNYTSLTPSRRLTEQMYDETQTWYQYFANQAKSNISETLILCESAFGAGIELSEQEKEAVAIRAKSINDVGQNGLNGKAVNKDDIENCLLLAALAQKYENTRTAALEPTAEEIEAYAAENSTKVKVADVYQYSFAYSEEQAEEAEETEETAETEESEAVKALTKDEAAAWAKKLKNCTSTEEFETVLDEYFTETGSEEKAADRLTKGVAYYETEEEPLKGVYDWMFSDARREGETYLAEQDDTSAIAVYMIAKPAYLDESATVKVRHILYQIQEDAVTAEQALQKAKDVQKKWQNGPATEESFGALALAYSDDSSYGAGGLYTGVKEGDMVTAFNDWIFDGARQPGDTDIVETEYGAHFMYFVGQDLPYWQTQVRSTLSGEKWTAEKDELSGSVTVTANDDLINSLVIQ